MRTFKIYSQKLSNICYNINCIHHAVHYIPMTYLFSTRRSYIMTSFTHLIHLSSSSNHQSFFCIYKFIHLAQHLQVSSMSQMAMARFYSLYMTEIHTHISINAYIYMHLFYHGTENTFSVAL